MNKIADRVFQIISNDDTFQFVEESDIEELNCRCNGKLKIESEIDNGFKRNVTLKCENCNGSYYAITHTPTASHAIREIQKQLNYDPYKIDEFFQKIILTDSSPD